jgi:hypothetical protein
LDADATTDEEAVFSAVMPQHYAGSGVTAYIHYAMSTAVANELVTQGAFERIGDQQLDIDADSFAAFQTSGAITVPATSGNVDIKTIAFTDGAQMDSVAIGESFRFKIRRDADDTSRFVLRFVGMLMTPAAQTMRRVTPNITRLNSGRRNGAGFWFW